MKKEYVKPLLTFVSMRSNEDVAAICWAYAKNGKDFYHDIPGYGHAILHIVGGSCSSSALFAVEFSDPNMTAEQTAAAMAYMDKVIAEAKAVAGNSATSFKQSDFESNPQPTWS